MELWALVVIVVGVGSRTLKQLRRPLATREPGRDLGHVHIVCLGFILDSYASLACLGV